MSTIQLKKKVIHELKKSKEYPNQTYNELLLKMCRFFKKVKEGGFLEDIQRFKMKELWDNKEDEAWEHV